MCFIWAQKDPELPFSEWKLVVDRVVEWCGPAAKINITGGEVLESPMSVKVLEYAASKSFMTGLTTNGYRVDKKWAEKLMKLNLSNINVSLDGTTPKTVNFIRGHDDFYDRTVAGIKNLIEARKKTGAKTKIIIKTLILSHNLDEVVGVAKKVLAMGADSIYYQPTYGPLEGKWSESQFKASHLWPSEAQHPLINKVFDELIEMKKKGVSIVNSLTHLNGMRDYLLGRHVNNTGKGSCDLDLTTMMFKQRGQIHFCDLYAKIGSFPDLKNKKLSQLVREKEVWKLRKVMRTCGKNCLSPCFSKKTMSDYLDLSGKLIGWFD